MKTIDVDRRGREGLICRDNVRADLTARFYVRVNDTAEDVLTVARGLGCARASEQATLEELFTARFSEALKTVAKQLDFEQLLAEREAFKDRVFELIGMDLGGFRLDDLAIDTIDQTPLEVLDPNNILDAQGIRKIMGANELGRRVDSLEQERDALRRRVQALEQERDAARATLREARARLNAPDFSYTAVDELRALLG